MDGKHIVSQALSDDEYADFRCCRELIQQNHADASVLEQVTLRLMQVVTEARALISDQPLWSIVEAVVADIPDPLPNISWVTVWIPGMSPTLKEWLLNLSEGRLR